MVKLNKLPQNNKKKAHKKSRSVNKKDNTFWMFGIHAVKNALLNKSRKKHQLLISKNTFNKLGQSCNLSEISYKILDLSTSNLPISNDKVHQGALLKVEPLRWGSVSEVCSTNPEQRSIVIILDRVTDPHNAGAILRTAEVFGVKAVVVPYRHSPPESGSLAKSASGALEKQPYIRVPNIAQAISSLKKMNYSVIGLDSSAKTQLKSLQCSKIENLALVFGSEGYGLRRLTSELCHFLAKIKSTSDFSSLNVSNAVAISLYDSS